ncbi:MAG: DNA cytosine methyltransferase [Bacteroidetes bacterium]|nr:DNA cytosine methyltransferase [Bacteroidota bacterium]
MVNTKENRQVPTTIDLFAGAGGLTEGFRQAGFRCLYANDINSWAVETFRLNHPDSFSECRPIEEVDPAALRTRLGMAEGELDVLIGGPPCQGFSINAHGRFLEDPRNSLFKHYIRFLDAFKPKRLLIENVPGMLSLGNGAIFDQIIHELEFRGYRTNAQILLAAQFGVPQERWRMIILGSKDDSIPTHPAPTHYATARANFKGGRSLANSLGPLDRLTLIPAVTVQQAISDLPRLELGEGAEEMAYDRRPESVFARMMREGSDRLYNHFSAQLSQQNRARMSFIPPGGNWTDIPRELLPKGMLKARTSDHTKRYGRLTHEGLAGTILTKCDPHWSAVFLPDQDRTLTVREAARMQSFPDRYRFLGPRVAQYEQVGNAVPVLLAAAIAASIRETLGIGVEQPMKVHVA